MATPKDRLRYTIDILNEADALIVKAIGFSRCGYLRVDQYEELVLLVARLLERIGMEEDR